MKNRSLSRIQNQLTVFLLATKDRIRKNVIGVIQLEFSFMQENEKTFECLELEISFHLHAIIICIMAVLNVLVQQGVPSEIEKSSVTYRRLFVFTFLRCFLTLKRLYAAHKLPVIFAFILDCIHFWGCFSVGFSWVIVFIFRVIL